MANPNSPYPHRRPLPPPLYSRRQMLRFGAGAAGIGAFGPLLAACAPADDELVDDNDEPEPDPAENGEPAPDENGEIIFLSTQLQPVEEAEAMRNVILADFDRDVNFIAEEAGPFVDRLIAESEADDLTVSVAGGLHGDMAVLAERGLLTDLSDLADELADRGFNEDFLDLARFGTDELYYIPWMQATYIIVARQEAMDHLPNGVDPEALTYEDWMAWGQAIADETGAQRLGFPAADDGLIHRFFQGHAYPSWTGALNTAFRSDAAVSMWEWMRETWQYANPQSPTYGFMQEPLLSGEVWVGWDHVARLITAMESDPEGFVALPSPSGPEGLGFMPVVAGLAIPAGAPNEQAARDLISYLTQPETSAVTLREVGFYPPTDDPEVGEDVPEGIAAQAEAVAAQTGADNAVPSLLPVGLGEQDGAYNDVFRSTFEQIVFDDADIQGTLESQGEELQSVLDQAEAECWQPDPEGEGTCQVG